MEKNSGEEMDNFVINLSLFVSFSYSFSDGFLSYIVSIHSRPTVQKGSFPLRVSSVNVIKPQFTKLYRGKPQEVFDSKNFLRNFAKFIGKHQR